MRELHLFAGAGGGIYGGMLLGHSCVCAVEIEPYRRKVLLQRQRDGIFPKFPIWDDVRTFDGNPWRGKVDVVCGGFPCQDISSAGNGAGIEGTRSGLWSQFNRVVCEVRPNHVLVENSPMLTLRGLGIVLRDLAKMGYNAKWGVFGAEHAGAIHRRHRIFILANSHETGLLRRDDKQQEVQEAKRRHVSTLFPFVKGRWPSENALPKPLVVRGDDGVANRSQRLKCIGDGQVPAVVKLAWETMTP